MIGMVHAVRFVWNVMLDLRKNSLCICAQQVVILVVNKLATCAHILIVVIDFQIKHKK